MIILNEHYLSEYNRITQLMKDEYAHIQEYSRKIEHSMQAKPIDDIKSVKNNPTITWRLIIVSTIILALFDALLFVGFGDYASKHISLAVSCVLIMLLIAIKMILDIIMAMHVDEHVKKEQLIYNAKRDKLINAKLSHVMQYQELQSDLTKLLVNLINEDKNTDKSAI